MKIFYAIQATGNGHISRAMELMPYLEKYGSVDIFLSGANSTLQLDAPIKFRSEGMSLFYTCTGKLDYLKMFRKFSPMRIRKEIMDLPVEKYDLVINDFECITSLACSKKKIPSVNFGHQASFMSDLTPRPEKQSVVGEWLLKNFAKSTNYVGLHFETYDDFILPPVIKKEIQEAEPSDDGFIAVYLPSYCEFELHRSLSQIPEFEFRVFSRQASTIRRQDNLTFVPVSKNGFNESLITCTAIICGAGFETPAEVLYLKKKMIVIPIQGQYEQLCNAAALERMGVKSLTSLSDDFPTIFREWFEQGNIPAVDYSHTTEEIVSTMMERISVQDHFISKDYIQELN
ncbi:MAG: glycosyl transferase [Bacteroidetes bacterium]|nr:MAG: glycosyl transferase [Bacteroidota bacterium]